MNTDQLFASIALLIELAQKGEIDPWDVQVIEVIDRYLIKLLANQETMPTAYETDLSQSGQAFLSASMLVLFKANTLSALELNPIVEDEELLAFAETTLGKSRGQYDGHIRRRSAALPPQKRAVTLIELIAQLQLMAAQNSHREQHPVPPHRRRPSRLASRAQITRATLELAHQENLTEVAGKLDQFLTNYSQHSQGQNWLNLDQLVYLWHQETSSLMPSTKVDLPDHSNLETLAKGDRVGVFWALLLLSAQSKVELEQEEFYQELKIRPLTLPVGDRPEPGSL
ncbi:segregation/condensation protein A [Synechocystis sp. PCC 7509]|uniref:segregation/condensation protein A n=1 Tax=Synechocystis sp. PCC 7509 TaxID=927677 RepID=UPI0002AC4EED|nr:segregation/condensation protein A [Synechocystis sp. PCC 7509]